MILARAITCTPLALVLGIASTVLYLAIKRQTPPDPIVPHPGGLLLFAGLLPLAAMALGLLISTVAGSLRQAVFILMGVLALQVVMTGLAPPFEGTPGNVMKWMAMLTPSRWASAGLGADNGLLEAKLVDAPALPATAPNAPPGQLMPSPFSDAIWTHDPSHVYTAAAALVAIAVTALVAATIVLRRQLLATK